LGLEHETEVEQHAELCPQLPTNECIQCSKDNNGCIALPEVCIPSCPACAVEKAAPILIEEGRRQVITYLDGAGDTMELDWFLQELKKELEEK